MRNVSRREVLGLFGVGAAGVLTGLAGCGLENKDASHSGSTAQTKNTSNDTTVKVGTLKGPTSMGLAYMQHQAAAGKLATNYEFMLKTMPADIMPDIIQGKVDICQIPAVSAAIIYNKLKESNHSNISIISISAGGILFLVSADPNFEDFSDLAGHTLYLTGKGSAPEYTMDYLLTQAKIKDKVDLRYKSDPTELVAAITADPKAIALIPQPWVTIAQGKNKALSQVIDLNDVWEEYAEKGSAFCTAVTIAQNDFIKKHPDLLKQFIKDSQASVDMVNADPKKVAPMIVKWGIIDNEQVAAASIPTCHIVCTTGQEMKTQLEGYFKVLYSEEKSSVGGALPGQDFYYVASRG